MPNYEIDWSRLVRDLTPTILRKPRWLALCSALIRQVADLHSFFLYDRRATLFELTVTPQVRILRYQLNYRYDIAEQRILVLDGPEGDAIRIYTEAENQPLYLPFFLSARSVDFEVRMPAELRPAELQIRIFLDRFKLPTKTYILTYF